MRKNRRNGGKLTTRVNLFSCLKKWQTKKTIQMEYCKQSMMKIWTAIGARSVTIKAQAQTGRVATRDGLTVGAVLARKIATQNAGTLPGATSFTTVATGRNIVRQGAKWPLRVTPKWSRSLWQSLYWEWLLASVFPLHGKSRQSDLQPLEQSRTVYPRDI